MRKSGVSCLLMGGQACVFYGAAEFSRNLDLIQILDEVNLQKLQLALEELKAERIAVQRFSSQYSGPRNSDQTIS